jgi:hypothetical protein
VTTDKSPPPQHDDHIIGGLTPEALLVVNMFIVRHLVRTYRAFDGDLLEAIVLGEIAHHNVSARLNKLTEALRHQAEPLPESWGRPRYLPTNAFSIAQATGIPRQTVRRKIRALIERGWLLETADGLVVSPVPFEHFREFNLELANDLLPTLNTVLRLLDPKASDKKKQAANRR